MSLVAYGSSDESGDSDVDDNNEVAADTEGLKHQTQSEVSNKQIQAEVDLDITDSVKYTTVTSGKNITILGHISDEEDDVLMSIDNSPQTTGLNLPAPKHVPVPLESTKSTKIPASIPEAAVSLGLPAPKPTNLQSAGSKKLSENDELEDMVKPKAAELAIRVERPNKKKKKIIKITAPNLADFESDEEEEEITKKLKPAAGGCDLFSLLPKPKNVSIKEMGRTLIPHTLTKKPAAKSKVIVKSISSSGDPVRKADSKMSVPALPSLPIEEDSDDEEGSSSTGNFFSINTENNKTTNVDGSLLSASSYIVTASTSNLPPVKHHSSESKQEDIVDAPNVFKDSGSDLSNAPLQFKGKVPGPSFVGPCIGPSAGYGATSQDPSSAESYTVSQYNNETYNMAGVDVVEDDVDDTVAGDVVPTEDLIRLQGKRKWGREAVNLIDVHADHHTSTVELTKNLTQEVDMHSHSKKKKDQPSGQQKRKHQITYLAHRAKEQEFELKNQWAQNKMTKMQSQSKYGF